MSQQQLNTDLTELRAEIERLPANAAGRERLIQLAQRIERQIDESAKADAQEESEDSLIDGINEAAADFEVEHPRTTGLLRRIINTLSSMGI